MNFTSFHFVLFFLATLIAGHLLKDRRQRLFLLVASYYFYGVFEPYYLILILSSTLWDYFAAIGIVASRERKPGEEISLLDRLLSPVSPRYYLASSVIFNIGLLGYFKYTNFGIEILNDLSPLGDSIFQIPSLDILLPVGISFYSFQSLSYTIDVYRGLIPPRRDPVDFAMYVAFFPQLVAGPIVRATTFFEQLDVRLAVRHEDIITGMSRIVAGFFKKLVLSDNLANLVNTVFSNPMQYHSLDVWLASLAFGFQIYLDFAGYTDIARGVARLFGFEFDVNFLYPMSARNITDHWKRWHISLTTWIRDYVYIPLGGSRVGPFRTYLNMYIIWILTGIWHGPAYHFIVWGVWQAVMLTIHRIYSRTQFRNILNEKGGILYSLASRIILFFGLIFGFIFFRAENMDVAYRMIGRMFGMGDLAGAVHAVFHFSADGSLLENVTKALTDIPRVSPVFRDYWILMALYFFHDIFFDRFGLEYFREERNRFKFIALMSFMILCIYIFSTPETPSFMYFQF